MTITHHFAELRTTRTDYGHCPVCGKKVTRSKTFTQTVNPFHPAVDPRMSTEDATLAVRTSLAEEARAWAPDFTHAACRGNK